MIAMLVVGFVITIGFAFYEVLWARRPVITKRFWRNRAVVAACTIGFFDFVSLILCFLLSYDSIFSPFISPPISLSIVRVLMKPCRSPSISLTLTSTPSSS